MRPPHDEQTAPKTVPNKPRDTKKHARNRPRYTIKPAPKPPGWHTKCDQCGTETTTPTLSAAFRFALTHTTTCPGETP